MLYHCPRSFGRFPAQSPPLSGMPTEEDGFRGGCEKAEKDLVLCQESCFQLLKRFLLNDLGWG